MRNLLLSIALLIGLTSCNNTAKNKQETEALTTVKTEKMKNILFVLTSHDELGNTGEKTGFWVEEFAAPYYLLKDKGVEITLASPKGGQPPIDPKSADPASATEDTKRFDADTVLLAKLKNTKKLSEVS